MGRPAATVTMRTLAAGNPDKVSGLRVARVSSAGFTLLELLLVLAIVGLASAGVGLALRDGTQGRLEREGLRLSALLESARARSQALGVPVIWKASTAGFVFVGVDNRTDDEPLPTLWLDPDTRVSVAALVSARPVGETQELLLGPDPIIAPQVLTLYSAVEPLQQVHLGTDGVRPFSVQAQP